MKTKRQVKYIETRPCPNSKTIIDPDKISVPQKYKGQIMNLIETNRDIVASSDKELGQT